uniref:Uncharacterized protein n=1 Tax=Aegilops tauschii subsp. strangulata TaxID=200361 RepID=A0A453CH43_AEGTS
TRRRGTRCVRPFQKAMAPHTTEADASAVGAGDEESAVEAGTLRHRHNAAKADGADDGEIKGVAPAGEASVERAFEGKPVPTWREQLTLRAFVVSFFLAIMFSVIVMKLNLTTGIIPSLNVSAGLLGFFFVRLWTSAIERMGFLRQPFTRQENTVIQTCVVAAYDIAFSGGFGNYLFAMSGTVASQATEANDAQNVKDPHIGWMIGFLFLVSFVGLFALVPLRKIMIVDYKLTYPSGTATAYLINGFHTPEGAKLANFLWGFFQWFYTAGDGCGFQNFPTLGLQAYKSRFYFDFSPTYVGVGMICPHIVNVSVLLGGILSWGVMWPLIHNNRGSWYSADLKDSSLHGLQGYRVFISIAMILGDGLYNFVKVLIRTSVAFAAMAKKNSTIPVSDVGGAKATGEPVSFDEQRRTEQFMKDQIPKSVAYAGYAAVAAVSIATAIVYRNMAILGVDGFSSLPKHCLTLCYVFFAGAILINLVRDLVPAKVAKFIPLPMAMAIPFYIGSYFAIDMFVGTVIVFVWGIMNKAKADAFAPAVASGLICGDGIWTLPQSILALAKVKPPICMKFLSRPVNANVDAYLGTNVCKL